PITTCGSGALDVAGLQSFRPFEQFIHNVFALAQRPEPFHLDGGVVDEDVWTVFPGDKPVAFLVTKPFDFAVQRRFPIAIVFRHCTSLLDTLPVRHTLPTEPGSGPSDYVAPRHWGMAFFPVHRAPWSLLRRYRY